MEKVKGPIVPMLTPFSESGCIDGKTLRKFTNWLIEQGVSALFPIGGSGERVALTKEEKKIIMQVVIEQADKRVPVWPGTGGDSIRETIELSQHAEKLGADAVVVVVPRDIEPTEDSIFDYYREIDRSIDIPIYLYEPGGYEPYTITPKLFKRLSELSHIAGIKDSSSNMNKITRMLMEVEGTKVQVIQGNEVLYLASLPLGITGVIGGGCNVYPSLFNELLRKYEGGDIDSARKLQWRIIEKWDILAKSWPLTGKIFFSMIGIPFKPICRVQTKKLSSEDIERLRNSLVSDDYPPY
ncbi:dihydrodipicolinate synthase family protein [bacterium]|nr:dihydrodipicolinate synthase family protein [bacterium]